MLSGTQWKAEPDSGQHVERSIGRSAVGHRDQGDEILRVGLGPLHLDVEVPVPGEHPGVDQLVLEFGARAPAVRSHQVLVG